MTGSVAKAVIGLAMVGLGHFVSPMTVDAQTGSRSPRAKAQKESYGQIIHETYGSKKNMPYDSVFAIGEKSGHYNLEQHLELINYYAQDSANKPVISLYRNRQTYLLDVLEIGMTVWDKKNGYKGVFSYDKEHDVIDVHNAGMDMRNKKEWFFAAHATLGISLPGTKVATDYAEKGFEDLQKEFPQIDKKKTKLRFIGHSCGGPIAMHGAFGMLLKGYRVDEVLTVDSYAAILEARKIARIAKDDETRQKIQEFITQKCTSLTPVGGSFVDKVPGILSGGSMGYDFGRVVEVPVEKPKDAHKLSSYNSAFVRLAL